MTDDPAQARLRFVEGTLERYEGPLTRYAYRLTGDLDRARDLVQETFVRLCRMPPGSLNGSAGEWLFTVCRNRAVDVGKKERRMKPLADEAAVSRACPDPPPGERLARRETEGKLLELLDRLPPRQQEVLRLKFQEGMSYKEISRVTALSVSNVGYLLHMGVKALRERMTREPGLAPDRGAMR